MENDDDLMDRLAIRAERMKEQTERAQRAQHEASARLDSVAYELETLKRELQSTARLPPIAGEKQR